MASSAESADTPGVREPRLSLQTRIALISVTGALTGALIGGLVTWTVTRENITSERADARRAERRDAYAAYFGDVARLWAQVFSVYEVTPRPTRLTPAERTALNELQATLTREYALVALIAPDSVRTLARALNNAGTDVSNALTSEPIAHGRYEQAKQRASGGPNSLLARFFLAARKDLGTTDG